MNYLKLFPLQDGGAGAFSHPPSFPLDRFAVCLFLAVVMSPDPARSQEAVRMSLASSQAAEARRQANSTVGYYNLKLGPTIWRFGTELGFQYNSNVRYVEDGEGDFIVSPGIDSHMRLPVTDLNSLTLDLRSGYSFYTSETDLSRWYITPGSQLNFDVFIGDFTINLHDRFSIEQNAYQDPTYYDSSFSQFQNAAGLSALWDLNELKLHAGYDHVTFTRISGSSSRPDGSQEVLFLQGGAEIQPGSLLGVESGLAALDYEDSPMTAIFVSDGFQWNAGLFYESPVSEYISFRGSAGYTSFDPQGGSGTNNLADDFSGMYLQISLRHRVNQYLEYTLSGGRTVTFSFYGGTVDMFNVRWDANWRVLHKIGLSTGVAYAHGQYLYTGGESFDQIGGNIGLSRSITEKLTASLGYTIYTRDSDLEDRDYWVHIVGLHGRYAF